MRFVLVPAGEFLMGSDEAPDSLAKAYPQYERRRFLILGDEAPVHRVRITRPFYLGRFEVTVGQFKKFLALSGYVPESVADATGGYGYNRDYDPAQSRRGDAFEGRDPKYSWANPGFAQSDNDPVVNVTWHDAKAMAAWLSRTEGTTIPAAHRGRVGVCLPRRHPHALLKRRRPGNAAEGGQCL